MTGVMTLACPARSVTALLARFLLRGRWFTEERLKLSGERSRSRRLGRYLFIEAGALRPAGTKKGARRGGGGAVSVLCGG